MEITRRRFLVGVAASGAGATLPAAMYERAVATTTRAPEAGPFFLTGTRWSTCQAICARLVPSGADPARDPGATEARAGVFIDRFLAAFELPASLADAPAIWLRGRFSGRQPEPDPATGQPSATSPPDAMLSPSGQAHFIPPDARQEVLWRALLYGSGALAASRSGAGAGNPKWASQVLSGLIPGVGAGGLRTAYAEGLDAFDSWSRSLFHTGFAGAAPLEQDLMLAVAGNIVLDNLGLLPLPPLPTLGVLPPAAAEALYPIVLNHTFQACYGLPEYRWTHSNPLWSAIGYDGDTQPLGNSVFDANLPGAGPGEGPNEGFGEAGVYVPFGGYREYRPVSTPDPGSGPLDLLSPAQLRRFLEAAVVRRAAGRVAP